MTTAAPILRCDRLYCLKPRKRLVDMDKSEALAWVFWRRHLGQSLTAGARGRHVSTLSLVSLSGPPGGYQGANDGRLLAERVEFVTDEKPSTLRVPFLHIELTSLRSA